MKHVSLVLALAAAAATGAITALLLAPKKGKDLRRELCRKVGCKKELTLDERIDRVVERIKARLDSPAD